MSFKHFLAHLFGINIVRLERWERGEPDEQKELVHVWVCSCGQVKGQILGGDGWKPLKKIKG